MYKDLHLLLYKTRDGYRSNEAPAVAINLRGCEVTPEVNLTQGKFNIKLEVPPDDGIGANSEMWVRCDTVSAMKLEYQLKSIKLINAYAHSIPQEDQYAKWMAACRLASKGRSLADSSYDSEVASIKSFLSMQKPAHAPAVSINPDSIEPNDFLSPRICKKLKGKVRNDLQQ